MECRSCHAAIRWAKTENGKPMPLDPVPTPDGNVEQVGQEPNGTLIVRVLKKHEIGVWPMIDTGPRFLPHFASCPHSDQYRKAKA